MNQTFPVHGTLTIDTDAKTFTLTGSLDGDTPTPPDPPVPPLPSGDAIDLTAAELGDQSPDVRHWPIGAKLTSVYIDPATAEPPNARGADMNVDFTKKNGPSAWPIVNGPEGEIQYTLWIGCKILGVWRIAGSILCISRGPGDDYVPTGPTLKVGQVPGNWYYFSGSPLAGYQPSPGEQVAWFLTSGAQRRGDVHTVAERTQVVLTPFSAGTFTF